MIIKWYKIDASKIFPLSREWIIIPHMEITFERNNKKYIRYRYTWPSNDETIEFKCILWWFFNDINEDKNQEVYVGTYDEQKEELLPYYEEHIWKKVKVIYYYDIDWYKIFY